jgi:hypothetical protein
MRYSKRQIEVWEARARLSEKLSKMTPGEITAYAQQAAERWRKKTGTEPPTVDVGRPPLETSQS